MSQVLAKVQAPSKQKIRLEYLIQVPPNTHHPTRVLSGHLLVTEKAADRGSEVVVRGYGVKTKSEKPKQTRWGNFDWVSYYKIGSQPSSWGDNGVHDASRSLFQAQVSKMLQTQMFSFSRWNQKIGSICIKLRSRVRKSCSLSRKFAAWNVAAPKIVRTCCYEYVRCEKGKNWHLKTDWPLQQQGEKGKSNYNGSTKTVFGLYCLPNGRKSEKGLRKEKMTELVPNGIGEPVCNDYQGSFV